MSVKVKICAIRSLKAAQVALDEGADFLGLVFTPNSNRTINLDVAEIICKKLKGKISLVGLFQNETLNNISQIINDFGLDYAQLHGDESSDFVAQIKIKTIKAFRLESGFDFETAKKNMEGYMVDFYLVDRIKQGQGSILDLEKAAALAKHFPLVFAGGLNPENIAPVITKVKPQVVDVASGVETDGEQDLDKIRQFIKNAKEVL